MKLISCDHCSAVLDHDKLGFARDLYGEDETIDESKAKYDSCTGRFHAYVPCPVCGSDVFKED